MPGKVLKRGFLSARRTCAPDMSEWQRLQAEVADKIRTRNALMARVSAKFSAEVKDRLQKNAAALASSAADSTSEGETHTLSQHRFLLHRQRTRLSAIFIVAAHVSVSLYEMGFSETSLSNEYLWSDIRSCAYTLPHGSLWAAVSSRGLCKCVPCRTSLPGPCAIGGWGGGDLLPSQRRHPQYI